MSVTPGKIYIDAALELIHKRLAEAASIHYNIIYDNYESPETDFYLDEIKDHIEASFDMLLVLLESLQLGRTHDEVCRLRETARNSEHGFGEVTIGDDEPYLLWRYKLWPYLKQISALYIKQEEQKHETVQLSQILKSTEYSITYSRIFPNPPQNEDDVHQRIESILKCYYTDLKTKPSLSKPIKNFIPDTGLPSIKTLIEYKYITKIDQAKTVLDEILADTRGYHSPEWKNIIFVIYETSRIKKESEWNQLLESCDIENQEVIVLHGTPATTPKAEKKTGEGLTNTSTTRAKRARTRQPKAAGPVK